MRISFERLSKCFVIFVARDVGKVPMTYVEESVKETRETSNDYAVIGSCSIIQRFSFVGTRKQVYFA